MTPAERLFIGIYPEGVVFADRSQERSGDYMRCGFASYRRGELDLTDECPESLKPLIRAWCDRNMIAGQSFEISASGQMTQWGGSKS